MSIWDWLQNKHEWNSLILPRGPENTKDLKNKLWHLIALGRWVLSLVLNQNFCTYLDLYSRVMLYMYTLLSPEGCTMQHSDQCQASIIQTGWTKPESIIWTQVRGHYPTLSTMRVTFVQLEENVTRYHDLGVSCGILSVCKLTSSSCWSAVKFVWIILYEL